MTDFLACHAMRLENECGTVALEAFLDIIQRLGVAAFDVACDEVFDLLPAVIRLHKLEGNIAEAFRKRK